MAPIKVELESNFTCSINTDVLNKVPANLNKNAPDKYFFTPGILNWFIIYKSVCVGVPPCRASLEGLTGLSVQSCLWLRLVREGEGQAPRGVGNPGPGSSGLPLGATQSMLPPAAHAVPCVCPGKPGTHPEPKDFIGGRSQRHPLPTKFQILEGKPVVPVNPFVRTSHLGGLARRFSFVT